MQGPKKISPQTQNDVDVDKKLSDNGMEMAILASLMKEPAKMVESQIKQLYVEHFTSDNNKYLYGIMVDMYNEKGGKDCKYDLSSLLSRAKQKGVDEDFLLRTGERYIQYLVAMQESHVEIANFTDYVDRVIKLALSRRLYDSVLGLQSKILTSEESPEELLIRGQNEFNNILISSAGVANSFSDIGVKATGFIEEAMIKKREILGIRSGFTLLDETIEGLKRGNLIILAAPKKTGKSAFLMNVALNTSYYQKIPTLMISTEMSDREIISRAYAKCAKIQEKKILKGDLTPREKEEIDACDTIFKTQTPFYHVEMRGFTLEKIIATTKKFVNNVVGFKSDGSPKDCLVVFDYIKMPTVGVSSSQEQKEYKVLGHIADGLKMLAGDLDIPIFTACQTNRAGDVANSYELTWFCNTFITLVNKSPQMIEKDKAMNGGLIFGNQLLKIIANRGGEEDFDGIALDFNKPCLYYFEAGRQSDLKNV